MYNLQTMNPDDHWTSLMHSDEQANKLIWKMENGIQSTPYRRHT
jgi:hypothetical protein